MTASGESDRQKPALTGRSTHRNDRLEAASQPRGPAELQRSPDGGILPPNGAGTATSGMPDEQPQDPPVARPPAHGASIHDSRRSELPPLRFLQELKRRNVGRVAILYIVVSYVALQVLELFLHLLELPAWAGRVAVLVIAVGFPVALVFAWVYEITPEGLKLTEDVLPQHSIRHHTGKRLDRAIIAVLAIALSYFVVDKFWLSRQAPSTVEHAAPVVKTTPAVAAVPEKSVAVLPFLDMSEKHDQEYFSDGLSEELIDMLTKVPDLRVPARTSSFYFKGKQTTIKDIAAALGVAHVLEGSVRKSGNTLRITAQLIRVDNGYHLWSETYDRKLDDIFKVQDEIAGAVVNALKVSLLQGTPKRTATAKDTEVYTAYLQSRFFYYRGGNGDHQRALDNAHEALRLDPTFAPAWSHLSRLIVEEWMDGRLTWTQAHVDAQRAAEKAAVLDPKLPDAYLALGKISLWMDWNWSAADVAIGRALDLNPDNVDGLRAKSFLLATFGHLDEALQLAKRLIAKDPLNDILQGTLAEIYFSMGRASEAESADRIAISLNPLGNSRSSIAMDLLLGGKPAAALAEMQHVLPGAIPRDPNDLQLAMIYHALGRHAESDAAMAAAEKNNAHDVGQIAMAHAYRGEVDQAFKWLERGYRERYWGMVWINRQPLLKNIEGDPRFKALLRKMNLPE
jgi:adenylate cyclase